MARHSRQLEIRGLNAAEVFNGYAALATIVIPAIITPTITNDPADDAVLACALAAQADLVVSGDTDLLDLKAYQNIPIVTAAEALQRLRRR